jgi:hypothetical protein
MPLAGSFIAGLIASLCCGGSLIFASIGLGAFYSGLGLFRYVPQALAAGALSILAINYLSYRRAAKQASHRLTALRVKMFAGTVIGLIAMAGAFILLEWLNHAVIHGDRFLAPPEFSQALIKGVPNVELLYVFTSFFTIALLWALPWHVARLLVERGARVERLWHAAALGMTSRVQEFLVGNPLPTPRDINNAFWQACAAGERRIADYLLAKGADMNWVPDYAKKTPLDVVGRLDTRRDTFVTWVPNRPRAEVVELVWANAVAHSIIQNNRPEPAPSNSVQKRDEPSLIPRDLRPAQSGMRRGGAFHGIYRPQRVHFARFS